MYKSSLSTSTKAEWSFTHPFRHMPKEFIALLQSVCPSLKFDCCTLMRFENDVAVVTATPTASKRGKWSHEIIFWQISIIGKASNCWQVSSSATDKKAWGLSRTHRNTTIRAHKVLIKRSGKSNWENKMETTIPIIPTSYFLSQGYTQQYAEAMDGLQLSIIESTINMKLKIQHPKLMAKSTLLIHSLDSTVS